MRILAWVATLAVVLGSAPAALASHMGHYALNPVEHDDQGRGLEPDGRSTAVLGPMVGNRVVDLDGDGRAEPDAALPAPSPGRTQELNPGCWGDEGRVESGRCGLWTVGVGASAVGNVVPPRTVPWPVSEDGRCQAPGPTSFPPGRLSGGCGAALRAVRMLDAVHHACASAGGIHYLEVNRKVDDAAARAASLGVGGPSQDALAGPVCIWAWYGAWLDKNGNGVIDAHADFEVPDAAGACPAPCDGAPVAVHFPHDEFVWHGACFKFGNPPVHNPASVRSGYCKLDQEGTGTAMVGWLYPGNHHAYLTAFPLDPVLCALCFYEPADLPGRQVVHFVGGVLYDASGITAGPCDVMYCELQRGELDEADGAVAGDPLLGPQDSVAADQAFGDRSGDPALTTRQWVYGLGWGTWLYDQSVLVRLVQVTGVGCPRGGPTTYDVAACRFADVDTFEALSAEAEDLLQGRAKPLLRSQWVFVRDAWTPLMANVDAVQHHSLLDVGALAGPVEARVLDPGFGREPNDPGDRFPGAVHNARGCLATPANGFADGERLHNGWCNDYAAHRAGPRAYADLREELIVAEYRPTVINVCSIPCMPYILATTTLDLAPPGDGTTAFPRAEGDHRRTFPPGRFMFFGIAGRWHDQAHTWQEDVFLELPAVGIVEGVHVNPPDGWIGNLVENLGAWYYRGYADEDCGATDQPAWVDLDGDGTPEGHSWAECHPYRDGHVSEPPQDMGAGEQVSPTSSVVEFVGACESIGPGLGVPPPAGVLPSSWGPVGRFTLTPLDGEWGPAPVMVWRESLSGIRIRTTTFPPSIAGLDIVDLTGHRGPIELHAACSSGGGSRGPFGSSDMLILPLGNLDEAVELRVAVRVGIEEVTDVDTYAAWGAAL